MTSQPISLIRGQSHTATIRIELGGASLDLATASAATFTARPSEYSPVAKITKALGAGVTAGVAGLATVALTTGDTAELDISNSYSWMLTATVSDVEHIVARGVLTAIGAPQQFPDEGGTSGPVAAADITDAGTAGIAVLQAETQEQARAAIGATAVMNSQPPALRYAMNEGSGRALENSAAAGYGNNGNLLSDPYGLAVSWLKTGTVTITANYTLDPFGGDLAARVEMPAGAANSSYLRQVIAGLANVSHTLSVYVMSNTGVAQTVAMYNGTTFTDFTIPASGWVRIKMAFTPGAAISASPVGVGSAGGAVDVSIYGPKFESGAIAKPTEPTTAVVSGALVRTTAGIDFAGNKYAIATIPAIKVTTFSMYAAFKWPTANAPQNASYCGIIVSQSGYVKLMANSAGFGPTCCMGNGNNGAADPIRHPLLLRDGDWHVLAGTYDGVAFRLYLDGDLIQYTVSAIAPATMRDILIADAQAGAFSFPAEVAHAEFNCAYHSPASVAAITDSIAARLKVAGVTIQQRSAYLAFEGDSITSAHGATAKKDGFNGVAYRALTAISPIAACGGYSVEGSTIAGTNALTGRAAVLDAQISRRSKNILHVLIGTNDLNSGTVATTFANLKNYCLARRAAGWTVVVGTLLSRNNLDAKVQELNALIRADSTFYSALADFAAEPLLGATGAYANTTYFADGIHPTTAGYALMAPIAQAAITSVLA